MVTLSLVLAHALAAPVVLPPEPGLAGRTNVFVVTGARPGAEVRLALGDPTGATPVPGCPGQQLGLVVVDEASGVADSSGRAELSSFLPGHFEERSLGAQAWIPSTCEVGALTPWVVPFGRAPLDVVADCRDLSTHEAPSSARDPALRVVSVYESPNGTIDVDLDLDHDVYLVLLAYESVHWTVTIAGRGTLLGITVDGHETQTLTAPPGAPILLNPPDRWEYAYNWYDFDTRTLVAEVEAFAGRPITSFHGCNEPSVLTLAEGPGPPVPPGPDCTVPGVPFDPPNFAPVLAACPSQTSEDFWCLTSTATDLAVVGLDSGEVCPVVPLRDDLRGDLTSFAWLGDTVHACRTRSGYAGMLEAISLVDGAGERTVTYCRGLTSWRDGVLLLPSDGYGHPHGPLQWFGSPTDLACETPRLLQAAPTQESFAATEGVLYLATETQVGAMTLPGGRFQVHNRLSDPLFDDPRGTSVVATASGPRVVVASGDPFTRLSVVRPATGAVVRQTDVAFELWGLECFTNPP